MSPEVFEVLFLARALVVVGEAVDANDLVPDGEKPLA
jgi:hypothetical protein